MERLKARSPEMGLWKPKQVNNGWDRISQSYGGLFVFVHRSLCCPHFISNIDCYYSRLFGIFSNPWRPGLKIVLVNYSSNLDCWGVWSRILCKNTVFFCYIWCSTIFSHLFCTNTAHTGQKLSHQSKHGVWTKLWMTCNHRHTKVEKKKKQKKKKKRFVNFERPIEPS